METKHPLQKLIEFASFETSSYSGRGMFGRECLCVRLSTFNVNHFLSTVFREMMNSLPSKEETEAFAEALVSFRTDQMGRGMVVYFPNVPFTDDSPESE